MIARRLRKRRGWPPASRHPLARALVEACEATGQPPAAVPAVREVAGAGLERATAGGVGPAGQCHVLRPRAETGADPAEDAPLGTLLCPPGRPRRPFSLRGRAAPRRGGGRRKDLRQRGFSAAAALRRPRAVVQDAARAVGIERWEAGLRPADKLARLTELAAEGKRTLMIGDGLNDAPALAAAHASMSPSSAIDIAQTAADAVFQGAKAVAGHRGRRASPGARGRWCDRTWRCRSATT